MSNAAQSQPPGEAPQPMDFESLTRHTAESICREAEQFLYREARLLDGEGFDTWLNELVDPDIRYVILSHEQRFRKERRYQGADAVPIYDDNHEFLAVRVEQFTSGMYWRMDPPEHYRRLVTNVEVFATAHDDELAVRSNCLATRTRRIYEFDSFVYCREDLLRRGEDGQLRLLTRHIDLDERCVSGRNMVMLL